MHYPTRSRWTVGLALGALAVILFTLSPAAAVDDHRPAPPHMVAPGGDPVMDSPIPPGGGAPAVQVPPGTGYCVTYNGDRVVVPFHHADVEKLDELRGSVRNALALIANQLEVKAATAPTRSRAALHAKADRLKARLLKPIAFAGEPGATSPASPPTASTDSRYQKGDDGSTIICYCSTWYGPEVTGGAFCGGPCGDCILCR